MTNIEVMAVPGISITELTYPHGRATPEDWNCPAHEIDDAIEEATEGSPSWLRLLCMLTVLYEAMPTIRHGVTRIVLTFPEPHTQ